MRDDILRQRLGLRLWVGGPALSYPSDGWCVRLTEAPNTGLIFVTFWAKADRSRGLDTFTLRGNRLFTASRKNSAYARVPQCMTMSPAYRPNGMVENSRLQVTKACQGDQFKPFTIGNPLRPPGPRVVLQPLLSKRVNATTGNRSPRVTGSPIRHVNSRAFPWLLVATRSISREYTRKRQHPDAPAGRSPGPQPFHTLAFGWKSLRNSNSAPREISSSKLSNLLKPDTAALR